MGAGQAAWAGGSQSAMSYFPVSPLPGSQWEQKTAHLSSDAD